MVITNQLQERLQEGFAKESLNAFNKILEKSIKSPRATYGRSGALLKLAELQSSNTLLQQGIQVLEVLLSNPDTPDALLLKSGLILADKQRFRGWTNRALKSLTFLNLRFPNNVDVVNDLGITNLILGRNDDAKKLFKQVLKLDADNGFAMAHLGFIIKVSDNNPAKAIPYLKSGIESGDKSAVDARFYFHLGDAYQRIGDTKKAKEVYDDGAAKKLFLSRDQRSLYNVERLTAKPWWDPEELPYQNAIETLQNNWEMIRDEVLEYFGRSGTDFINEAENLLDRGMWRQMTLYQRGERNKKGCLNVLKTCALLNNLQDATNCRRGQVKFSIMKPGSHVWPHCGPTNCRLRAHLGLVIPDGVKIRVGNETRHWKEGEFLIFDDSFEHEVWHQGNENRIVLIVDFWHPELTEHEKSALSPI
ncbi:aspartyl/asparaginyl beta-hydroxylase-like [Octopus sinensis]|uniref:Aspartyl/asparaginyl beta-hydroxylase-like n=1 Tax=Octopus sinensis TaxID=2607531 RepID=A0A6P7S6M0_9MOLL|nr:aspartyl/asparaginyl beta-hydroxylase-like [Octopus sinensis]